MQLVDLATPLAHVNSKCTEKVQSLVSILSIRYLYLVASPIRKQEDLSINTLASQDSQGQSRSRVTYRCVTNYITNINSRPFSMGMW